MKQIFNNQVSAFEAKTHFSNLLSQVKEGKKFVITKHDLPVAILTPIDTTSKLDIEDAISQIINFSNNKKLKNLSIKELKETGRR